MSIADTDRKLSKSIQELTQRVVQLEQLVNNIKKSDIPKAKTSGKAKAK